MNLAKNIAATPHSTAIRNSRELPDRTGGEHSALNFVESETLDPRSNRANSIIFETTSLYEMNSHTHPNPISSVAGDQRAERRKSENLPGVPLPHRSPPLPQLRII